MSDYLQPEAGDEIVAAEVEPILPGVRVGQYYRVDSSRASFTELWRDCRSPIVVFAWIAKLLRAKLPGSVNDPNVVTLAPFEVSADAVEDVFKREVLVTLAPTLRELEGLGFEQPLYYHIDDRFHHSRTHQVAMRHRDGKSIARVTHRAEGIQGRKIHFFTEHLSALADGTLLYSSSAKAQLFVPPGIRLNWHPRHNASQLWIAHREALPQAEADGARAIVLRDADAVAGLLERHHETIRDYQIQRGVFASLRGEDLAKAELLERSLTGESAGSGAPARHPEVLVELERIQTKQTSWMNAVFVLVLSIGFFAVVGKGAWQWSWEMVLLIIGVLFVHEAGHYVAMKIFHYRNVRMFFIPFFGAAVSGQNYAAPGWKKVVVALMGPLPGIFLGGILGVVAMLKHEDALLKVATFAVILNGFQLLPVLPLDGGRVMHAILFSRHHLLDVVFNLAAALILAGIGAAIHDKLLLYLGVIMLLAVPATWKVGKIAMELRRAGYGPPRKARRVKAELALAEATPPAEPEEPDEAPLDGEPRLIPEPVAEVIIDRTKQRFPKLTSARQVAQYTIRIYETLVARPPGIIASVGFTVLHIGSFLVAFVLLVLFVAPRNSGLMAMIAARGVVPKYTVTPSSITVWRGPDAPATIADPTVGALLDFETNGAYDTLVASFSSTADAKDAYTAVVESAPAAAVVCGFGQSVMLTTPSSDEATRSEWFARFEEETEDVFVASGGSLWFTFTFDEDSIADAVELEGQLQDFLTKSGELHLIPPWTPPGLDARTAEERRRHAAARALYGQLNDVYVTDAPELKELNEQLTRALRRQNRKEIARLNQALDDKRTELNRREMERLRDAATDPHQRELAERYLALWREREAFQAEQVKAINESASSNGVAPMEDLGIDPDDLWEVHWDERQTRERDELGVLMGQWPLSGEARIPSAEHYSLGSSYGYAQLAGGKHLLVNVLFADPAIGAPAFVEWLERRGCSNLRYEVGSQMYYPGFDSDED